MRYLGNQYVVKLPNAQESAFTANLIAESIYSLKTIVFQAVHVTYSIILLI